MKILLISTSFEDESRSLEVSDNSHYPLGLAYIHSYLEQCGHIVKTLFLNDYAYDTCLNTVTSEISTFAPDFIGVQLLSHNRVSSYRTIEYIHDHYSDVKLFIGGIHTTVMYKQILEKYPYLIAVIGEGEITCSELIDSYENPENVHGIAYVVDQEIRRTPPRTLIKDLDILPFPKHEIFFNPNRKLANLLTSRGCPFACSFCVLDSVSRRRVRYRSIDNVVSEIEHLKSNFPQIEKIWIHDDSFFLDNQRVIDFCDEVVKRNIKVQFVCSGRMKPLSKKLVEALERAGFIQVLFGLESGSDKVLKLAHKGITKADAKRAFEIFADSNIIVTAFLIVGLHGENDETILETINTIQELQHIKYTYYNDISVLTVYPGTEIYRICKDNGLLNDDFWMTDQPVPLFTVEHTAEKLFNYKEKILNCISCNRIQSLEGYITQRSLFPQIIKYSFENNLINIMELTTAAVNHNNLFQLIMKNIFNDEQKESVHAISGAVDDYILVALTHSLLNILLQNILSSPLYSTYEKLVILGIFFDKLSKSDYQKNIEELIQLITKFNRICIPENKIQLNVNIPLEENLKSKIELSDLCMANMPSINVEQLKYDTELKKAIRMDRQSNQNDIKESVLLYDEITSKYYYPLMEEKGYVLIEQFLLQYANTMFSKTIPPFDAYLLMLLHYFVITNGLIATANRHQTNFNEKHVSVFLDDYVNNIQSYDASLQKVVDIIHTNHINYMVCLS